MENILVVDDDERLLSLIVQLLKKESYFAKGAKSAKEARAFLSDANFDAIIIDWMMPEESGVEFVKSLKDPNSLYNAVPTIALTAMDNIDDKLEGFSSGFDDYLTKPFDERELLARLNSLIKRSKIGFQEKRVISFGNCSFDMTTGKLIKGSENVCLTSTEATLLRLLCQNPNRPLSREELSKKLGVRISERSVDARISRLRKKLGDNPQSPSIIKTERHVGYSIVV